MDQSPALKVIAEKFTELFSCALLSFEEQDKESAFMTLNLAPSSEGDGYEEEGGFEIDDAGYRANALQAAYSLNRV